MLLVFTKGGRNSTWKEIGIGGAEYPVELQCFSVDRGDTESKWKEIDTVREGGG